MDLFLSSKAYTINMMIKALLTEEGYYIMTHMTICFIVWQFSNHKLVHGKQITLAREN